MHLQSTSGVLNRGSMDGFQEVREGQNKINMYIFHCHEHSSAVLVVGYKGNLLTLVADWPWASIATLGAGDKDSLSEYFWVRGG